MAYVLNYCDFTAAVDFLSGFPALIGAGVFLAAAFWVVGIVLSVLLDVMRAG